MAHGLPSSFPFYVAQCRENTESWMTCLSPLKVGIHLTLVPPQGLSDPKGPAPHQASETESPPERIWPWLLGGSLPFLN